MLFPKKFIIQTGVVARACLAPGQRGKVLAAFSKAIYLLTETGELFWITTEDAPLHQRCAQIATPLSGPSAGSLFHVEDQRLTIDPGFAYDVDHALLWNAPRLDPNQTLAITQLPARLQAFFSQLDFSQAKGFGTFIPHILSLAQNALDQASAFTDPVLLFAYPVVLDMARACLDRHPLRISKNADALIGLGAGLTPSGDDFLGGCLFAVKILQAAYPNLSGIPHSIPIETYHSRTHLISFTLLTDLASGQAIEPVHYIINGLLSGETLESIHPSVSHLTQVGHSTGWDMLAGLLTGLLTTYRSGDFTSSLMDQRIAA